MQILEYAQDVAASAMAIFFLWAFSAHPKMTPKEFVGSPPPLHFAARLSMAVFLLCATIENGLADFTSVRWILYAVAAICAFLSIGFAYCNIYNNSRREQAVAPNRSLPPTLNSASFVRGSEDI